MREWQIVTVALRSSSSWRDRLADEVRASDDDGLGALQRDVVGVEQLDHPERRARPQPGLALGESPGAERGEPVDVLERADEAGQCATVEAGRNRQLEQDPADLRVLVALLDDCCDLGLADAVVEVAMKVGDPGLGAGLALVGDVDRRRGIVADENRGEAGDGAGLLPKLGDVNRHLGPDASGHCLAVDDRCAHGPCTLAVSALGDRRQVGDELALGAVLAEADDDDSARFKPGDDPLAERRMADVVAEPVGDGRGLIRVD